VVSWLLPDNPAAMLPCCTVYTLWLCVCHGVARCVYRDATPSPFSQKNDKKKNFTVILLLLKPRAVLYSRFNWLTFDFQTFWYPKFFKCTDQRGGLSAGFPSSRLFSLIPVKASLLSHWALRACIPGHQLPDANIEGNLNLRIANSML
jgi:hypothetical protein